MALLCFPASPIFTNKMLQHSCFPIRSPTKIVLASKQSNAHTTISQQSISRRSANYQQPIWDYDYVQSLNRSELMGIEYTNRMKHLKDDVRMVLDGVKNCRDEIKLIDTLERLGLAYHFQDEINAKLEFIAKNDLAEMTADLYDTALGFRLLRQHGHKVPQEVFTKFRGKDGKFIETLGEDIRGILSLYEASFLSEKGESILDEAREFATQIMKTYVSGNNNDEYDAILVKHALELPLHWRMRRLEARWFIQVYERDEAMNPLLLELAKLDFNYVQSVHQEDLKEMIRWWNSTNLGELSFARERIMESFFWTVGIRYQPQYNHFRRHCTKLIQLITTTDDIYDVYGTVEEIELFTRAIERWEINAVEQLPNYMKNSFLVVYNTTEEIASDILEKHGTNVISHLKKLWADLFRNGVREAKWFHNGYTPTLKEYTDNAWISISGPLILSYAYFLASDEVTQEATKCLMDYPDIIKWSSIAFRFINDLGTSSDEIKRGDVPKSIQCYMHETGASESEAREYINHLIAESWKEINKASANSRSIFPQTFIDMSMNITRMAHCAYLYGDGFGRQDTETAIDHIQSLLYKHIDI